jgi:long-chain acyl-CoA synthetase
MTDNKNITELFHKTAQESPEKVNFHHFQNGWETITYKVFSIMVISTASYLINTGLKKGERVAVISENRHEWGSSYLSIILHICQ